MPLEHGAKGPLTGIALASAGYACFAAQDAVVKWLVTDYAVSEILFFRSMVILVIAGVLMQVRRQTSILRSPHRKIIVLRAALMLLAWLLFYNAARFLGLAELTTLYFSAPIMVMVLSIFVLKETIGVRRWLACIIGFVGVVVAANPTQSPHLFPALMCVVAGFCWAWSTILIRLVSRSETTLSQMWATSVIFALACGISLPWTWTTPDATGWALLLALGLIATLGQYLLYDGFRYAPASTLAPIEYTGLMWAFVYGYLIWAEIPAPNVFVGAVLIVASSVLLILWERHAADGAGPRPAGP